MKAYVCVCVGAMRLHVSWMVLLLGLQCAWAQQHDYEEDYDEEEQEERNSRRKAKSKLITPNLAPKNNAPCEKLHLYTSY